MEKCHEIFESRNKGSHNWSSGGQTPSPPPFPDLQRFSLDRTQSRATGDRLSGLTPRKFNTFQVGSKDSTLVSTGKDESDSRATPTVQNSPVSIRSELDRWEPDLDESQSIVPFEGTLGTGSVTRRSPGRKFRFLVNPVQLKRDHQSEDQNWIQVSKAEDLSENVWSPNVSMQDSQADLDLSQVSRQRFLSNGTKVLLVPMSNIQRAFRAAERGCRRTKLELEVAFRNLTEDLRMEHDRVFKLTQEESRRISFTESPGSSWKSFFVCGKKARQPPKREAQTGASFISYLNSLTASAAHDPRRSGFVAEAFAVTAELYFGAVGSSARELIAPSKDSVKPDLERCVETLREFYHQRRFPSDQNPVELEGASVLGLLTVSQFVSSNEKHMGLLKAAIGDEKVLLGLLLDFARQLYPAVCRNATHVFNGDSALANDSFEKTFNTTFWGYLRGRVLTGKGSNPRVSQQQVEETTRGGSAGKGEVSEDAKRAILKGLLARGQKPN